MKNIKVGLLPLYIKLYDDVNSDRTYTKAFYDKIAGLLKGQGFDVIKTDFCRIKSEFKTAVETFENEGADAIVTLHMAYSPSLESIDALAGTKLPIVVLDSTGDYSLSALDSPAPVSNNHGIHGVMDMCNLLKQRGKPYAIAAGHTANSNVIKKTADFVRAAVSAKALNGSKVGAFGTSFDGMGDFLISKENAKEIFGIEIVSFDDSQMSALLQKVTDEEIANEKAQYQKEFDSTLTDADQKVLDKSIKACLAVRRGIEEKGLDAFSVNFLDINSKNLDSMPFVECCKQMQKGVGYAGEGDVLTASFVGALLKTFAQTSFIEIFCPDWKNDKLLISHMAEMNYALSTAKPELNRSKFSYTDADDAIKGFAEFKTGPAVFGNVYRDEDGKYKLLLAEVEMCEGEQGFDKSIRGWFKAKMPIAQFLETLSEYGAIHHSFLVYDTDIKALEYFGKLVGLGVNKI